MTALKLNLGCGNDLRLGYLNIDKQIPTKEHWEIHDLEKLEKTNLHSKPVFARIHLDTDWVRLPNTFTKSTEFNLKHGSVHYIRAFDIVEHLRDLHKFMQNVYHVLEPGGLIQILVPHYKSPDAWIGSHKRAFSERTFEHWCIDSNPTSDTLAGYDWFKQKDVEIRHKHPFCWHQRKYLRCELIGFKPHNILFSLQKVIT